MYAKAHAVTHSIAHRGGFDEGRGGAVFDIVVVGYLFLGGAGAGVCLVLGILGLLIPSDYLARTSLHPTPITFLRYDPTIHRRTEAAIPDSLRLLCAPGWAMGALFLMVGIVCLLVDLGRIDRVVNLLMMPQLSYVAVGAYALAACILLAAGLGLVFARIVHHCPLWLLRLMLGLTVLSALIVLLYTGMLLASMPAVPLWNVWALPVLFACSGLSCGIAILVCSARLTGVADRFPRVMQRLFTCGAVGIVVELVMLGVYLYLVPRAWPEGSATALAAAESLELLLTGDAGILFQIGYVVAGLILPLAALVVIRILSPRAEVSLAPFVLVTTGFIMVGGFIMRWCIVMAGVQPAFIGIL